MGGVCDARARARARAGDARVTGRVGTDRRARDTADDDDDAGAKSAQETRAGADWSAIWWCFLGARS